MRALILLSLVACGGGSDKGSSGGGGGSLDSGEPEDSGGDDTGDEPAGPVAMEVGEVVEVPTDGAGGVAIELANPGTYMVVLVSQATGVGDLYGYGDAAAEAPVHVPSDPPPVERAEAEATRRSLAAEGDTRSFSVWNGSAEVEIEAQATAVTDLVVFWVDQTTPNELGEVDQETIDGVLDHFASIVVPRERQVFGEESDVDEDDHIHVLLTYTVNQYGPVAYVTQCDIGATRGCGGSSNDGEIIYLGVPDPESSYSSDTAITEVVAHELNHLIYGWHKYVAQERPNESENIYLTEGMSALAQDLTGYNNGNQYVWAAALDARSSLGSEASIDSVSANDVLRGDGYYDEERDGALRGGAYLLLRYLFEQSGGMTVESDGSLVDDGGMTFLHDWFDQEALGADTVEATTGRPVNDVVLDWYTALVMTGLVETDNPAWTYQDRVEDPLTGYEFGVDPYDTIHGWLHLHGPLVQAIDEADGSIRAGGVEYLEVELGEAGEVAVAGDPEAALVARLIRVE